MKLAALLFSVLCGAATLPAQAGVTRTEPAAPDDAPVGRALELATEIVSRLEMLEPWAGARIPAELVPPAPATGLVRSPARDDRREEPGLAELHAVALLVLDGASELCFERTGALHDPPPWPPPAEPAWDDLLAALVQTRARLAERLHASLLDAHTRIDALRARPLGTADVFLRVTESVHRAARLLSLFDGVERIPEPPPLSPARTLEDAHRRLARCAELAAGIARSAEHHGMAARAARAARWGEPADAYRLACLLSTDLAQLGARCRLAPAPPAHAPGPRTAAQLDQRIALLERQLEALLAAARADPQWPLRRRT